MELDGCSVGTTDTAMEIFCVTRNRKHLNREEIYRESINGKYFSGKGTVGNYVVCDVPGRVPKTQATSVVQYAFIFTTSSLHVFSSG